MAWVLERAARYLADFAPALFSAALPGQLEPTGTGTPPPFIRALLGGGYSDALGVAFHQSGLRTDWISNDSFDQRVCSRRACDARSLPSWASALFAPADEVEPFEREVVAELIETLAPALGARRRGPWRDGGRSPRFTLRLWTPRAVAPAAAGCSAPGTG